MRSPSNEPWSLQLYTEFPLWAFYLDKRSGLPKRVWGVGLADGEPRLRTVTATSNHGRDVWERTAADDLDRVDKWPRKIHQLLKSGIIEAPGRFSDPLGFILIYQDHYTGKMRSYMCEGCSSTSNLCAQREGLFVQ